MDFLKTRCCIWVWTILLMTGLPLSEVHAQETDRLSFVIHGEVRDNMTNNRLANVNISLPRHHFATVTNADGVFTLKTTEKPDYVVVSHVGYKTRRINLSNESKVNDMKIRLVPNNIVLADVVVMAQDPVEIMKAAIKLIPENYSKVPELLKCFYRETAQKRNRFIYISEAVTDLYKTSYSEGTFQDRVAIEKARRLLSQHKGDTLSMKMMGGPAEAIVLDVVKERGIILDEKELSLYDLKMKEPVHIADRLHYVVSVEPRGIAPYALYHGTFFIDKETLSFTRAELSLDMSDREKATRMMLVKKPMGVRFRPKELSIIVSYRYEDGITRLSYVRSTFRFNCDWKKRLFATSFTAFNEMVVTDRKETTRNPISRKASFGVRDSFADMVGDFNDPDFWKDYNIIEPTETLENAIGKLKK